MQPVQAEAPTSIDTLQRVLVVARWLCWAWMAAVVAVSFSRKALVRPGIAWACVAVMLVVSVAATKLSRTNVAVLRRPPWVIGEAVLALMLAIADGWVFNVDHVFATSQSLATEWPLVVSASFGIAFGSLYAGLLGALFGPALLASAALNDFSHFSKRHIFAALATTLFYGAFGAMIGWLVQLLKRSEEEISHHRARNEMSRVLHDTVLQTLALVDRRSRDSDPELAATARQADRELRNFLFSDGSLGRESLSTRIHHQVERVRANSDINVVVNVIEDNCRLNHRSQDAIARAIGEAVANAIEHARPTRIVVFAEADDDDQVFATVRDDGRGFDAGTSASTESHGISQSIVARMEDIGGYATLISSPTNGTEVSLWTRNPAQFDPQ